MHNTQPKFPNSSRDSQNYLLLYFNTSITYFSYNRNGPKDSIPKYKKPLVSEIGLNLKSQKDVCIYLKPTILSINILSINYVENEPKFIKTSFSR